MNHILRKIAGAFTLAFMLSGQQYSIAQQQTTQEETPEEQTDEQEQEQFILDLGLFQVDDYRPTDNETLKVAFHVHAVLSDSANEHTVKQLAHWQHRLRNQVLIAVRLSHRKDFLEKDLSHFRRIVQLRINRTLSMQLIDDVLLTEFTFTMH